MNLEVRHLTKRFGGVAAIDDVTLDFPSGSLSAVIGPNGAGKSTFFNLISGALLPDGGQILVDGEEITGRSQAAIVRRGLGRAFQVAQFFPTLTVRENLMAAVAAHRGQWGDLARRFPPPGARTRADEIAAMLGLTESVDRVAATLSHGDQKLLDIALALALEPKILLLDEPTAGMGPEERARMIDRVQHVWAEQKLTLVFIEHDMEIVFRIAERVAVLCYGRLLAAGTPAAIRADPAVIAAYLGTEAPKP
ncbi:MAG: ABC transporter ATP-binding protein [Acidobacteriia bacterium]|nr:ABC transporter ATP-binding protein [Methyloceanibacter sp.]MBX5473187.1 ABC transporter ATP-binding protein [Acetobacteraceae bacterium]MCL6492051.1 ABC transporter ATP-binding protein [Terriglobia bacterium]